MSTFEEITFKFSAPEKDKTFVSVVFTVGEDTYTRNVNAVFVDEVYSEEETKKRVQQVANGVLYKFNKGVIKHDS